MEQGTDYFFRLPFILYPEKIPKNRFDAVEKASIALYVYDEIKKSSFFKKGEKLRLIKKIYLPFILYRNGNRGLVFSNLIDFKNIGFHNFPANIPVLPEELNSNSFDEFVESLNEIYLKLDSLEVKTEFLENYPSIKMILDLEYLLHYPGMNQALITDHSVFSLEKQPNLIEIRETIRKYKKMNSFLLSLKNYFYEYPIKKIDQSESKVILFLEKTKKDVYQEYEILEYDLRKDVKKKIEKLELKKTQEIEKITNKFNSRQVLILESIAPKLNKSMESLKSIKFEEYKKEIFHSPDEYITNINENHDQHQNMWKKHEDHFQEVIRLYNTTVEEEKKELYELSKKIDTEILNENKKIIEKEKERDNKISELEVQETNLDNQVKNIKTVFQSKLIEIDLILQKIKSMTINISDHPMKESFQDQKHNILGLPFYIVHIEGLEKPITHRFIVIPPVTFPEKLITFTKDFQIYGSNPDLTTRYSTITTGNIAFNNVSDQFNNIAHQLLTNITFHAKTSYNPSSELVLTKEEINKLLTDNNLLLDPLFETGVYNGLDWLDTQRNILRRKIGDKTRNVIIHFFDELNNLILKHKSKK
ncbi:MAG: hypothetical protein HeimC3_27690 [Candidatus Heimdallarchaeota archaeon LC_3]|nr:MAG: hypothetical protein HeimC3_27690 [Candidatus Heimdallarchaeota archaeon LC_3]